jgi:hypothetical protein
MALTLNGTEMTEVNLNGTRMEIVNINGTEVYRAAASGDVTYIGTGYSFDPGVEDINRHFVLVGGVFSGFALPGQPVPTVNGVSCSSIQNNVSLAGGDGGAAGIFTIKIPTGTGTFTIGNVANYNFVIYRVTGIFSMATALDSSSGGGTYNSSANGCFFGVTVQNFGDAPVPSPNSAGLAFSGVFGRDVSIAASNTTTGPTQSVSLGGSQINAGATFAYDLF